jgi:TonB-dependent starch-binding outer membrane protein SusC
MFKKRLTMQISKNVRRIALFFLSMVLSSSIIFAQERTITGKVTAEGEGPLPGVNVTVQGTVIGAITDQNGAYTLKVPGPTSVLLFSSIGYSTKQVIVGTQTVIDVVLVSDVTTLSEVVVTGYTSQRRRDLTGSVGVVEPAKLTAVPTGNISNSLQGRTSGVTVIGNGQPNSTSRVRIRGFSSFENNDPLYVVDGVPTQDIASMNPNDIESLSVLKDAGAASIYGSRASNGVIIVTTKRGSKGTKVNYSMYAGVQDPGNGPDNLLSSQEYANLQWLVYKNDGTSPYVLDADGNPTTTKLLHPIYGWIGNATPTMPSWAANTNWYKAVTHKASIQNHDLSLSGGSDNAKFFAGLGVRRQDGIIIYTNQNKYTARFNSEFTFLKDRVKIGENFTGTYSTNLGVSNLGEGSPISMGAYREQPIIPVRWTGPDFQGISHLYTAGEWGGTGIANSLGNATNPVANLTRAKDNKYWDMRLIGSTYIDIKIFQGLNFKSTIGGTWYNGYGVGYNPAQYENVENTTSNSLGENAYYGNDWVWTNQVTLDKTFGSHKILAVVGYEADKYGIGRDMSAGRGGYFTDDPLYRTLSNGSSINYANSNFYTPTTLESQFARADYAFMDRYMLSATVRRDGSSRFGSANRFGIFPSFSAGWRISDESFFKAVTFINDLKLRGSWGTMGNQLAVSPQNQFYSYGGDPGSSFYAVNGGFSSSQQGFRPTRIGNPDAKWETNVTTDIGFEASLLNSKIGIKFDWYQKKTKDLLFAPELPGTAGAASAPYINIAAMSNTGFDAELSFKNKWGDFGFDGSAVITTYKNNIDKIANGVTFFDYGGGTTRIGANNRNMVGHPMSAFFGYKEVGLFQVADFHTETIGGKPVQVVNTGVAKQDGAAPGFFRFQDTDGDGTITPADRVFIGNPNPKFTYGFNLSFTYKNFDLSTFLYGSYGNDIFNSNRYFTDFWTAFQGQKSTDLLYNSWTVDNPGAKTPKASSTSNFSTDNQVNSYYLENGSYLRMKNLELGYTLPESVMSRINVKSLRIYVQAVNLLTVTKYSGLDPELGGDDRAFGSDTGNYPLVRNFIFGLNLNF